MMIISWICFLFCLFFVINPNIEGTMTNCLKNIQAIFPSPQPHMVGDGFRVFNYFSGGGPLTKEVSPFLLLDYNAPYAFPPNPSQSKGVGAHPNRGFETVTIVYEGALAHRDSTGSGGVIQAGDVQWMTAASGILHEEFHEANFAKLGGTLHAIQLWVNLPSKEKMSTQNIKPSCPPLFPLSLPISREAKSE
jgi:redox-sensitive bicupin YhaK (pirin superfamily)